MVIGPASADGVTDVTSGRVTSASGLNFAWPGRENHDSETLSVLSSSGSEASASASDAE